MNVPQDDERPARPPRPIRERSTTVLTTTERLAALDRHLASMAFVPGSYPDGPFPDDRR